MVNEENKPRVWLLTLRQSEITSKEDRDKLSPTELYAWDPLTCLQRSWRGSGMSERLEESILGWRGWLCLPGPDSVSL